HREYCSNKQYFVPASLSRRWRFVGWSTNVLLSGKPLQLVLDSLADPAHHEHGLAVADGLVARAVRAFVSGLAAIGDASVVPGEALEPFALPRDQAAYLGICLHRLNLRSSFQGVG